MDAKIQVLGRSLWLCVGNGCEEERGEGDTQGEDCCIVRGRNDYGHLDQHGGNGRREADTFWK